MKEPMEIPAEALSADALAGLMEEFVLQEGTDYGVREVGLDAKVEAVRRQLERGEARILFFPEEERCTIVTAEVASRAVASPDAADSADSP